jgi:hypothetical protein
MRFTQQDLSEAAREFDDIDPGDEKFYEKVCLKIINDCLREGRTTLQILRKHHGGTTPESTIHRAAKAMAFYTAQTNVNLDCMEITPAPGLRQMIETIVKPELK